VTSFSSNLGDDYNPMGGGSDTRTWRDLNGDDIAQENELGPTSNVNFGTRQNQNHAPDIRRPYQWVYDIAVQHEVVQGLGVSVSYNRRDYRDLIWTTNLAAPLSAYTLTSVANPLAPGQTLPVYNLNPAALGLVNLLDDNSPNNSSYYQGFDISMNVRWRGAALNGGTSTGHTISVTCDVQDPNNLPYCDQTQYEVPLRTLARVSGTYELPFGIRTSAVFQSVPGAFRQLTYVVTRAVLPTLTQASVNARLNAPNTLFLDTVNQLDLSFSKSVRTSGIEVRPEVSVFNALNANPVLTQVNTFGPALGNVQAILAPRLLRLGLTIRF